jgi:hypothetical protein
MIRDDERTTAAVLAEHHATVAGRLLGDVMERLSVVVADPDVRVAAQATIAVGYALLSIREELRASSSAPSFREVTGP